MPYFINQPMSVILRRITDWKAPARKRRTGPIAVAALLSLLPWSDGEAVAQQGPVLEPGTSMDCRIVEMVTIKGEFESFFRQNATYTFFPEKKRYVKFSADGAESIGTMKSDRKHITLFDEKYELGQGGRQDSLVFSQRIDRKSGIFHGEFKDMDGGIVEIQQGLCAQQDYRRPSAPTEQALLRK